MLESRFDTELEAALRRVGGGGASGKRRRQVVVLGAGMDTRPWRHGFLRGAAAGSYKLAAVCHERAVVTAPCSAHAAGGQLAHKLCCVKHSGRASSQR